MATDVPVLLDSDTLSELSRGHPGVVQHARRYLLRHGRLTLSAVTVFERLRGYRLALRQGKPFEEQLARFEELVARSVVLPVDESVSRVAALIWSSVSARQRRATGDILIAATAAATGLPLVTRNHRDFSPMASVEGVSLDLFDWTK